MSYAEILEYSAFRDCPWYTVVDEVKSSINQTPLGHAICQEGEAMISPFLLLPFSQ
jgi:hypothetical protein